uniref:Uncharacterized protein n=1 Tax=Sphaerodactylus townsendi TaxID=933632 RepID=A0ACB8G3V8_9SAUR
MEMLLSQVEQLHDLLAVSCSGLVRGWDVETLQRALGWSCFFQQLSKRLHCQLDLRTAVARCLCQGCWCRAAFQLLSLHLAAPPEACAGHWVPPQLRTQAQLLLLWLPVEKATGESLSLLHSWTSCPMASCSISGGGALRDPPGKPRPFTAAPLVADGGPEPPLCFLPPPVPWMASLCSCYPELHPHSFNLLASWGNLLNYDLLQGVWKVAGLAEDQVPWQEMQERVFCLLQEPEPLCSAIGTELIESPRWGLGGLRLECMDRAYGGHGGDRLG